MKKYYLLNSILSEQIANKNIMLNSKGCEKMTKDVKMFYIESDIKKIQTKTNLYIQKYGPAGAFHLAREIIQNNIDEIIDPESNGSSIYIRYDKDMDCLTCEDDGRGFPETDYPLDIFCTKNQSGSKFFRDQGGDSAGELNASSCIVVI